MKKIISTTVLSVLLTVGTVRTTNAAIATYTAFFSPAAAAKLALTGLATIGIGYGGSYVMKKTLCEGEKGCLAPMVAGWIIGMIFLDEGTGMVEFRKLDRNLSTQLNVETLDIEIFNSELEEANAVLAEVSSKLTEKTTHEDLANLWEEYEDYLSPESFKVSSTTKLIIF